MRKDIDNIENSFLYGKYLVEIGEYNKSLYYLDQAIYLHPNHSQALFQKGTALFHLNEIAACLDAFDLCHKKDPENKEALLNKGLCYLLLKRLQEALDVFEKLLKEFPNSVELLTYRSKVLIDLEKKDIARECNQKILLIDPKNIIANFQLGCLEQDAKNFITAIDYYKKCLMLDPSSSAAWINLSLSFIEISAFDEAFKCLDHLKQLKGSLFEAYFYSGFAYLKWQKYQLAIDFFHKALEISPNDARVFLNLGKAMLDVGEYERGVFYSQKCIEISNEHPEAFINLSACFFMLKDYENARQILLKCLEINPKNADAKINLGFYYVMHQEYLKGFELYDARFDVPSLNPLRSYTRPLLQSNHVEGKIIFLYWEQGYGDIIQYARYAKVLGDHCAEVFFQVPNCLKKIMQSLDNKIIVLDDSDPVPYFDFHCPLVSMPKIMKTQAFNVPYSNGYLQPSQDKIMHWQKKISSKNRPKIGFCYSGSKNQIFDKRIINPEEILDLFELPFDFYCLQKDIPESERPLFESFPNVFLLTEKLIDFHETSAAIFHMDLIISIDTSVAHLAGALNKKTWILLPDPSDFRWHKEGDTSPWYNSVTLIRQKNDRLWSQVIHEVKQKLLCEFNKYI